MPDTNHRFWVMTRPQRLSESQISAGLAELDGWEQVDDEIVREFRFDSFAEAIDFMAAVAPMCDELNHHPTWTNTYNRLEVRLTTHDADGLSALDLELAGHMNRQFATR